ncbi:hypothetical protein AB1Y20_009919 [Prymnesium parvum]|uniref:Uncharacterized protein n=1 Tax=Prymnesium parvum TaxID=97485 RepID=A0AB34K5L6_PRYPA
MIRMITIYPNREVAPPEFKRAFSRLDALPLLLLLPRRRLLLLPLLQGDCPEQIRRGLPARGHARLEERLDEVEARASSVRVMLERRLDQSDSSAKEVVDALSDIRQMMREANDKLAAEKAEHASFFGVLRSLARNASLSLMKHKATIAVVVLLVLGRCFEAESATVASVVKGGLAVVLDGFIASVGPTLCMAVMSVFGAVLQSAVARDAPPVVAGASSDGAACAASGQPSKKQAVLYDSGCTALLTNNTHGQVGERRTVSGREFATANGKVAMNTVGTFVRTIYDVDGASHTFTAEWYYQPSLPFVIIGHAALRQQLGAFYIDCDVRDSSARATVVLTKAGNQKLRIAS